MAEFKRFNAQQLLNELASQSVTHEIIDPELEDCIFNLFAKMKTEDAVMSVLTQRFALLLNFLERTTTVAELDSMEHVSVEQVQGAFIESAVLLAAGLEGRFMSDQLADIYLGVLREHHMRFFFLDAASAHLGPSRNILWEKLVDELPS
jgi:hypothetical protein